MNRCIFGVLFVLGAIPSAAQLNSPDGASLNSAQAVYTRIVVVKADGANSANGTALVNALAGITTAAADNRFVIQLEPGIYDIGSRSLVMKPFVDLKGSGQNSTTLTSGVSGAATVEMADGTEARNIRIVNTGSNSSVARVSGAAARFWRVLFAHEGPGGSNTGLLIEDRGATAGRVNMKVCDIAIRGSNSTGYNRGISVAGSSSVLTVLVGVQARGSTSENTGIFLDGLSRGQMFHTAIGSSGANSVGLRMSPGDLPHILQSTGCAFGGDNFSVDAGGSTAIFRSTGFAHARTGIARALFMQCWDNTRGVFAPIIDSRAPVAP